MRASTTSRPNLFELPPDSNTVCALTNSDPAAAVVDLPAVTKRGKRARKAIMTNGIYAETASIPITLPAHLLFAFRAEKAHRRLLLYPHLFLILSA